MKFVRKIIVDSRDFFKNEIMVSFQKLATLSLVVFSFSVIGFTDFSNAQSLAFGRGKGRGRPKLIQDPSDVDPSWFKPPPMLGNDKFLNGQERDITNPTTLETFSPVADGHNPQHSHFWDYWTSKHKNSDSYGFLRKHTLKDSPYLPYLTLRESYGLGKVIQRVDTDVPDGADGDLPKPDSSSPTTAEEKPAS